MELTCRDCPRRCGADRTARAGYCGMTDTAEVAEIGGRPFVLHRFEEPVVSGTKGTAAIFFCGCNLGCVYCQNRRISFRGRGRMLDVDALARLIAEAARSGAHSVTLITAGHFIRPVSEALRLVRPDIEVPVVWNSGGYESPESIDRLAGLVDVFLPDFKYLDPDRAARYSHAPDYGQTAVACIRRMTGLAPEPVIENGILSKGVLIRHLVLPGGRRDGENIMRCIADKFPRALVSIMRQYTPAFCPDAYPELKRKVTSFEYDSVVNAAADAGLKGFMQGMESADARYTPDFD